MHWQRLPHLKRNLFLPGKCLYFDKIKPSLQQPVKQNEAHAFKVIFALGVALRRLPGEEEKEAKEEKD